MHRDSITENFEADARENAKVEGVRYRQYRRKGLAQMAPWEEGFDMAGVSVSDEDAAAGSPKVGDMIAQNPDNYDDKWLVAAAYFEKNFEPA